MDGKGEEKMQRLISLKDFEIVKNKKMTTKSVIIKEAIRRLRKDKKIQTVDYEDVIDPFELMIECYSVLHDYNKTMGNTNGRKK
jgi:hypothetical protein